MASRWLPIILALEITTSLRPTDGCGRNTTAYPRDEHCQSVEAPAVAEPPAEGEQPA
jgi:hypothetical protein